MGWLTGFFIYVVVWWIVLFAVLPWGVRTPDEPELGMASSAPVKPRILFKFAMTSIVSLVVWGVIVAIIQSDLISFREMAKAMGGP